MLLEEDLGKFLSLGWHQTFFVFGADKKFFHRAYVVTNMASLLNKVNLPQKSMAKKTKDHRNKMGFLLEGR